MEISTESSVHSSESSNTSDVVDGYLKKYKLDLKLLPNKRMIKLSDLCSVQEKNENMELDEEEEINAEDSQDGEESENAIVRKKSRKKREPSLKLQQKLTNQDLELIVSMVRDKQAKVFTADVKKDDYIDKILRIELENKVLSNGKSEALLKKSIFSKESNTLFETFINCLCGQDKTTDENGNSKPVLKCLVVDCDFRSFSEAEIMRHIKRHLAQDGYTCSECSHQFASMTNLQRHLKIHAGDLGKEVKCPQCDYKASTITHVKRHMAHKHLERSLPCPHCTFMGATNAELKIHMARKHLELTGKNPLFLPKYLRKDYQCNLCKEQFNDFKEYQNHMYKHTSSSNRFRCTQCPYNCKNYSKLKRHMLYHTGARNFECSICGNKFFQMEHLKRHLQSIHNSPTVSPSAKSKKNQKTEKSNQQDQGTNQVSQSFTVLTKCMFKCQKCNFNSEELLDLNQHMINEHPDKQNQSNLKNDSYGILEEDSGSDEDNLSDFEDNFDQENFSCFNCSFCDFKSNKKSTLKSHLISNHSSNISSPITLNNDSLINDPKTKFQCSSCNCLLDNLTGFTNHMMEKHRINVYLMETQNDRNENQSKAGVSTENKTKVSQKQAFVRATRHLKANSYQKSLSKTQNETSVRINPLYLKQFQKMNRKNTEFHEQNEILNDFVNNSHYSNQSLDF